ncbi:MAG: NADH-quinone oxidoreductase subunit NuoF [Nitrospiraceae bacterium]|nr:NADH-quinone oxidoreductase subunit NuoF [Nitrospiraceae bacterium]
MNEKVIISVCVGTGGMAAGALDVIKAFETELAGRGVEAEFKKRCEVHKVGCRGFCAKDVLVDVTAAGKTRTYQNISAGMAPRIVDEHILQGNPVMEWAVGPEYATFHGKQHKLVLAECGIIDPEEIGSYMEHGGYKAAAKALLKLHPEEIINEIKKSGLRGRGGAGFPTGMKWEFCRKAPGTRKCVICNADEGDPGAFMDRSVVEGNPHSVIEGMLIGAFAIGANEGYVYIRAEYPLAVERLKRAIGQARESGWLGKDIQGSGCDFDIRIGLGAGAFVCGEETALIASLEGQIGEPRPKPPFPANKGLWGMPTNINNVETWATVPKIINNGAPWFSGIGSEKSKGTKIFSLVGKIKNTGLVEVPMGMPLKEIIYDIGGGVPDGKKLKAVQTGGPSGGCITADYIETPVDYESLGALGSIMGSGGMVVMDEDTCMVDVARFFLSFCMDESCGQCTPCREGTKEMVRLLEEITRGEGTPEHITMLEEICAAMKEASLCGLGKTASNPVLSTLKYFRHEYDAHIFEKKCPAAACRALINFRIDENRCKGCGMCLRNCPQGAITGQKKKPHTVDPDKCIKCGACLDSCKFGAVSKA